jgi:hypothetical protein
MLEHFSKCTWEENGVCGDNVTVTVSEIYNVRILYLEPSNSIDGQVVTERDVFLLFSG